MRTRQEILAEIRSKGAHETGIPSGPLDTTVSDTPPPPPNINAASRALNDELKKPPPLFASAQGTAGVPALTPAMESIVESVYDTDIQASYSELEKMLSIGDQRADYATVLRHIDNAETNARKAHKLFMGAKLELEKWELDSAAVLSKMRAAAVEALEEEKIRGDRKKQITNPDVDAQIAAMYPDEWRHQRIKRERIKGTVASLENLSDLWLVRCKTLSSILSTLRK
jgi:hypothetical protein